MQGFLIVVNYGNHHLVYKDNDAIYSTKVHSYLHIVLVVISFIKYAITSLRIIFKHLWNPYVHNNIMEVLYVVNPPCLQAQGPNLFHQGPYLPYSYTRVPCSCKLWYYENKDWFYNIMELVCPF